MLSAMKHPRTRSTAVRHWREINPIAYKRDLVTNEKVQFQSLDPNRTFEKSFFPSRFPWLLQGGEDS